MSHTSSRRLLACSLALVLVVVVGCGKKNALTGKVVNDAGPCTPSQITPSPSQAPAPPAKPATLPTALVQKDLVVGKGCPAAVGAFVKVAYIGQLAKTGATFDSSWASGTPIDFQLGGNQVIAGWETGLVGMKVGGRRLLVIPAAQAYGKPGFPPKIGPDEPLQFVVDLLGVYDTPKCLPPTGVPAAKGKPVVHLPDRGPTELATKDLTRGSGPAAKTGSYVQVRYVGIVCRTGKQAESTWDAGSGTVTIAVGSGKPVPGFDQGLVGAQAGGQRQLDIPAALAYGATGKSPAVGPNESISYVVDIVAVSDTLTCAPATGIPPAPGKPTNVQMPSQAPKKLGIKDLTVGTGPAATKASKVEVRYVGVACSTGKQFDASWDRGSATFPVTLGQGQVIPGWDQGLVGAKAGGRRQLDIPAALAYGAQGQGTIGPNEPLTFVIDVVTVDGKPAAGAPTAPPTTKKP